MIDKCDVGTNLYNIYKGKKFSQQNQHNIINVISLSLSELTIPERSGRFVSL